MYQAKLLMLAGLSAGLWVAVPAVASPKLPTLPEKPKQTSTPLPDRLTPVSKGEHSPKVLLTGRSQARRTSAVAPNAVGVVQSISVEVGESVKKGQVMARLDSVMPRLQVKQAEASVALAEAQFKGAERDRKRLVQAGSKQAIPESTVDKAVTGAEMAKAQLELAKAGLALARRAYHDTFIRAPYDGLVTKLFVSEGDRINGATTAVAIKMEMTDPIDVVLNAPETLVKVIQVGQKLHLNFPATGQKAQATVTRVVRSIDPMTGSFQVIVEVPNPEGRLAVGTFAEGRFEEAAQ